MIIPLISVIIPCYNSGEFLPEAIESVESYPNKSIYEIIIVDDGSTDILTKQLLKDLEDGGYHIIHQKNEGPASARNTGVKASKGEFLLFLDSDNKIRNIFIDLGIKILKEKEDVGVVYGNASFFGEETKARFIVDSFDFYKIFIRNYIDMCSLVRRKVWNDIGPLDESPLLIGHEDWEYWLRVGISKWRFFHVDEVLFDYRVRHDSLVQQTLKVNTFNNLRQYVYSKYLDYLIGNYEHLYWETSTYKFDQRQPFRTFIKYFYKKYLTLK